MKKIRPNLSKALQISCEFDDFDHSRDKFVCRQLDIFDHCLTEEEARKLILSYPVLKEKKSDLTEYYAKEELLLKFLLHLYEKYPIILCRGDHFSFESKEEFKEVCIRSIREEELATFHIVGLDLTIYGNFDMNLPFNFSAANPVGVPIIEKELSDFDGLYLL